MSLSQNDTQNIRDNWQIEKESVLLYQKLAGYVKDKRRKRVYESLAAQEMLHAAVWEKALTREHVLPQFTPRLKIKLLLLFVRFLGSHAVNDVLARIKQAKIQAYFNQLELCDSSWLRDEIKQLVRSEKQDVALLALLRGEKVSAFTGAEWHHGGRNIRDIIFGMNDGLLSTFSLVAGVAGGGTSNDIILLAGLAGAVAGAISMGTGAFVAVRAEREVMQKQLAIEKKELELMPESEQAELSKLYENKGIPKEQADHIAATIMNDTGIALDTMAREELGFATTDLSKPGRVAVVTGIAFLLGSLVPLLPLLMIKARIAFTVSLTASLCGFFLVGAGRTIVTGKSAWRSGLEMLLIGALAAGTTFLIGNSLSGLIVR